MKVTLLGTGTSQGIPVIGCTCPTCVSSDPRDKRYRTSAMVEVDGKNILIDLGPDFRSQMLDNKFSKVDFVLFTHEHNDHTAGIDDIRPINFMTRNHIDFYGPQRVLEDIRSRFAYAFDDNPYPGAPVINTHALPAPSTIDIQGITIETLEVMHGNLPIYGFKIKNLVYLTDVSFLPKTTILKAKGCEVLIISALRLEEHYSHLTLDQALDYIQQINPQRAYLIHMSHSMGPLANWEDKLPSNVYAGYDGLHIML